MCKEIICKRLLSLFFLVFCLFQVPATPSFNIDWSKLDNSLNTLEWNLAEAETTIESLQTDLEEQTKYSASQQILYKTLEDKYILSEKHLKICRTLLIVITAVAITEGIVIYKCVGD